VLIALFEHTHVHHEVAHGWFAENRSRGWATCPLTENGFVRVLSRPMTGRPTERVGVLSSHLAGFCAGHDHVFWTASISLRDSTLFDLSAATHRQLADIYLAGLAHVNGGVLATFDRSIPVRTILGSKPDLLEVIGA
jgi:uncharacterized protein